MAVVDDEMAAGAEVASAVLGYEAGVERYEQVDGVVLDVEPSPVVRRIEPDEEPGGGAPGLGPFR